MTFSQPIPEELTRWTMCACDTPDGCGHAAQVSRLEAELEGRRAWCSKLGHQMGKTTSLLHHSEARYGRLLAQNEALTAKVQEFAQALEDIAMIVAGHSDSESLQAFYRIHERLTPYCGNDDLKPWLPTSKPDEHRYIGYPDEMAKLTPVAPAGKKWESGPNGWSLVDVQSEVTE